MNQNPNLNFRSDYRADTEIFKGFLNFHKVDPDRNYLQNCFFKLYPELKDILKEADGNFPKKEISSFIQDQHEECKEEIKAGVESMRKRWSDKKDQFYELAALIFNNHPWPDGDYVGFTSIWGIYPRNLESKKFSFPYNHPKENFPFSVVIHEMVHFIFFDYAIKSHPKIFKEMNKNRGIFWDLSEIFNAIILFTPDFIELHGMEESISGTLNVNHKDNLSYLKKLWYDDQDIDIWLEKGYKYLKDKNI